MKHIRAIILLAAAFLLLADPVSYRSIGPQPAQAGIISWGKKAIALCGAAAPCRSGAARGAGRIALKGAEKVLESPAARQGVINVAKRALNRLLGKEVRVFRVEGAPNTRVLIGENGKVGVIDNAKTLFLNFGDKKRAADFLAKRQAQGMDGATLKEFSVSKDFVQSLRQSAVPEAMAKTNPGKPLLVDTTKTLDSFGLRAEHLQKLVENIIPGSGKIRF